MTASVVKNTVSRMLLVAVCSGFGVSKFVSMSAITTMTNERDYGRPSIGKDWNRLFIAGAIYCFFEGSLEIYVHTTVQIPIDHTILRVHYNFLVIGSITKGLTIAVSCTSSSLSVDNRHGFLCLDFRVCPNLRIAYFYHNSFFIPEIFPTNSLFFLIGIKLIS